MQQTLLQIVQTILSSMDSDEVNSINDTVESYQVATLARQVFYDMAVELDLREHETLLEINSSGSSLRPVLMTVPTGASGIEWVKYDNRASGDTSPNYVDVQYVPFKEFLIRTQGMRTASNTSTMSFTANGETFEIVYMNDRHPTFFTTYDGTTLLFDACLVSLDTTLQKSKIMAFGNVYPTFTLDDAYTPDLDPAQFPLFINKCKVRAFNELKQQINQEAVRETRSQKIVSQKRKERVKGLTSFDRAPKYGRK